MYIMIIGGIREEELEWIEGQSITAVIVYSLAGGKSENDDCLPSGHEGTCLGNDRTERIEDEPFQRVVVERAERIGHVEAVMHRVDMLVEEFVDVE